MMRVGLGYDIHQTGPGSHVTLGSVVIPAPFGLVGHSDADVVLHAIMDAVLGAASLEDIGTHFPPTDDRLRGVSSLRLLEVVYSKMTVAGFRLVNVDLVVVAEQPVIGPHRGAMREAIARALHVAPSAIGVKATTNEQLGPEGRSEAISAHAVALLEQIV